MSDAPGVRPERQAIVPGPYVASAHRHQQIQWLEGVLVRVLLDAATTGGELAVLEEVSSQPYATPLHLHPADDQTFIVLEGSLRVWVGDDRHDVNAGGIAFLPRNIPHAVRVTSAGARLLVVGTPGRRGRTVPQSRGIFASPSGGLALSPPRIAEAGASIGHRILGPPPAD